MQNKHEKMIGKKHWKKQNFKAKPLPRCTKNPLKSYLKKSLKNMSKKEGMGNSSVRGNGFAPHVGGDPVALTRSAVGSLHSSWGLMLAHFSLILQLKFQILILPRLGPRPCRAVPPSGRAPALEKLKFAKFFERTNKRRTNKNRMRHLLYRWRMAAPPLRHLS